MPCEAMAHSPKFVYLKGRHQKIESSTNQIGLLCSQRWVKIWRFGPFKMTGQKSPYTMTPCMSIQNFSLECRRSGAALRSIGFMMARKGTSTIHVGSDCQPQMPCGTDQTQICIQITVTSWNNGFNNMSKSSKDNHLHA